MGKTVYNDMKDSSNDRNNNNNCYKLTKSLQLQREAQLSRVGIEPTTAGFIQMFPLHKVHFTLASLFNNKHNSNTKCTKNNTNNSDMNNSSNDSNNNTGNKRH